MCVCVVCVCVCVCYRDRRHRCPGAEGCQGRPPALPLGVLGREWAVQLAKALHQPDGASFLVTAVPGDASESRAIAYSHPRAKPVCTDGLRVLAWYTDPYSLRSHPSKIYLSLCKFSRHYHVKPTTVYSNFATFFLLLGMHGCFLEKLHKSSVL